MKERTSPKKEVSDETENVYTVKHAALGDVPDVSRIRYFVYKELHATKRVSDTC